LLITVAIAAVLAAVALPNMGVFVQNNARSSRMNNLVTAFNIARNEAISKQTTVTVCASTTSPAPATYTCNGTNRFEDGWIVLVDRNANGAVDPPLVPPVLPNDQVLRIFEPDMAGSATLRGRDSLNQAVPRVSFDSSGQLTGFTITNNMTGVRFTYCDSRGVNLARAIIMGRTGHSKISRDGADADDIHEVAGVNIASCL